MGRKIGKSLGIVLGIIILLIVFILLVGRGPFVDIPADAQIGREYPAPDEDEVVRRTTELVLNSIKERYADADRMLRDAHPYSHGCVHGTYTVNADIPTDLKHGIFAEAASYPVWIRFSNGSVTPKPDIEGDIRGMAVKLMEVPGAKIQDDESGTQDFLLISNPVLPVGDPGEYLALFEAALAQKPMSYFFGGAPWNWKLSAFKRVLDIRTKKIPGMLWIRYWSTVPFKLGDGAVKYSARPCDQEAATAATVPEDPSEHYLREGLASHLNTQSACFEFMIQKQTDPVAMPLEDPAVEWDEDQSPFVPVARIEIPAQNFDTPAQNEFCENLAMNPWHALPAHRPLGGINRVRRVAYDTIARYRMEQNGVRHTEPTGNERFGE
ncbi:MAG: catalase family protein [Leptospiraceae bacterium]|nr:catalase family protein [Leptospiraceae bacterium]